MVLEQLPRQMHMHVQLSCWQMVLQMMYVYSGTCEVYACKTSSQ